MTKRSEKAKVRNGLVKYPGGRTYFYFVRFRGKIRRGDTGCESHAAAVEWLKREREGWALSEQGITKLEAVTLAKAHQAWVQAHTGIRSKDWVAQVKLSIPSHQRSLLNLPIQEITTDRVRGMLQEYLGGKGRTSRPGQRGVWELPHSPGGANTQLKILTAVVRWAVEEMGWASAIPFDVKKLKLKVQEKPEPVIWPELVPAFLAAVDTVTPPEKPKGHKGRSLPYSPDPDIALGIRLQLALGLRESEALGVRWEWLDFRTAVYQPGKTKNRRTRIVPMPGWLFELLHFRWLESGCPSFGLVMPGEEGKGRARGYTLKHAARAGLAVGIHGLHPHRLRATFATTHFEAGTPISQIQQMMGHKDPSTTMGYIIQRPKDQAEAQDRVAALMGMGRGSTTVTPSSSAIAVNS